MTDMVNSPSHYQSATGLEAYTVIESFFFENYDLAQVFRYTVRAGKKFNELEDLQKAQWYLKKAIDKAESKLAQEQRIDSTSTEWPSKAEIKLAQEQLDRVYDFHDLDQPILKLSELEPFVFYVDVHSKLVWIQNDHLVVDDHGEIMPYDNYEKSRVYLYFKEV